MVRVPRGEYLRSRLGGLRHEWPAVRETVLAALSVERLAALAERHPDVRSAR
jgi:hypothetical protein